MRVKNYNNRLSTIVAGVVLGVLLFVYAYFTTSKLVAQLAPDGAIEISEKVVFKTGNLLCTGYIIDKNHLYLEWIKKKGNFTVTLVKLKVAMIGDLEKCRSRICKVVIPDYGEYIMYFGKIRQPCIKVPYPEIVGKETLLPNILVYKIGFI